MRTPSEISEDPRHSGGKMQRNTEKENVSKPRGMKRSAVPQISEACAMNIEEDVDVRNETGGTNGKEPTAISREIRMEGNSWFQIFF